MKKILFLLLILTSFVFVGKCQISNTSTINLTKRLNEILDQGHINGFAVAIVNQDSNLYVEGFGFADIKVNKKYAKNTVQNIASISKTFIGIALLKAQELGKLNLNDPINKHLPFKVVNPFFPNDPITIRQLASHTSSITDPAKYEQKGYVLKDKNNGGLKINNNFRQPDEFMELEVYLNKILHKNGDWYRKKTFLNHKPGDKFNYSNIGAGLAALVLEHATGQSFREFTNDYIFKPLKMSHSGWTFDDIDFTNHTRLYANTNTELAYYRLITYPDGGLITSIQDLSKYLKEIIAGYNGHGKLLKNENYNLLFKGNLNAKIHEKRDEGTYNDEYDMGIFMGISSKGQIGHSGGDPGVATLMFFNSKTNIGKILMVNTELNKEGVKAFISIWKTLEEFESKI